MVKNEGLWLSAHGHLPGTLWYAQNNAHVGQILVSTSILEWVHGAVLVDILQW